LWRSSSEPLPQRLSMAVHQLWWSRCAAFACMLVMVRSRRASETAEAARSAALDQYNPAMTTAFAALSSLAYCAGGFPRGVPRGLSGAVEKNCGGGKGSFCKQAGFEVVSGTVRSVNLADLGESGMLFAIVARWRRSAGSWAAEVVPRAGCLLAVRGSIGVPPRGANWRRNNDTELVKTPDWPHCHKCQATGGYYKAWQRMEPAVLRKLKALNCTAEAHSPLYITGHSMGAAISLLAMYALKSQGFDVQVSYTFGAPKPGNAYFATAFARLFKRDVPLYYMTHANDFAPVMPRGALYHHIPYQVYYHGGGTKTYIVCNDPTDGQCGINMFNHSELVSPKTSAAVSPHCIFPEAPYGNLCIFTSYMWAFTVGAEGAAAYQTVCASGGLMDGPPQGGTERTPQALVV